MGEQQKRWARSAFSYILHMCKETFSLYLFFDSEHRFFLITPILSRIIEIIFIIRINFKW